MCQIKKDKNYALYLDMPYLQKLGLTGHLDEWTLAACDLLSHAN